METSRFERHTLESAGVAGASRSDRSRSPYHAAPSHFRAECGPDRGTAHSVSSRPRNARDPQHIGNFESIVSRNATTRRPPLAGSLIRVDRTPFAPYVSGEQSVYRQN